MWAFQSFGFVSPEMKRGEESKVSKGTTLPGYRALYHLHQSHHALSHQHRVSTAPSGPPSIPSFVLTNASSITNARPPPLHLPHPILRRNPARRRPHHVVQPRVIDLGIADGLRTLEGAASPDVPARLAVGADDVERGPRDHPVAAGGSGRVDQRRGLECGCG